MIFRLSRLDRRLASKTRPSKYDKESKQVRQGKLASKARKVSK